MVQALALAAPAANLALNYLTSPRETAYERQLNKLADIFKQQMDLPYFQTSEGKVLMNQLETIDKRRRKTGRNSQVRSGASSEMQIAQDQAANEAMSLGTANLASRATGYRQQNLSNYMAATGAAGQVQAQNEANWLNQIGSISGSLGQAANNYINILNGKAAKEITTGSNG